MNVGKRWVGASWMRMTTGWRNSILNWSSAVDTWEKESKYICLQNVLSYRVISWQCDLHNITFVFHCSMNAVFCRSYREFDALYWLKWRTALLVFLSCPTWSMLNWSNLQRRVTGVWVIGVLAQRAGSGAEDESRSREEGKPQQR